MKGQEWLRLLDRSVRRISVQGTQSADVLVVCGDIRWIDDKASTW